MKLFIRLLIVLSTCLPAPGYGADRFMNAAREAVAAQNHRADSLVDTMVSQLIGDALGGAVAQISALDQNSARAAEFKLAMDQLAEQLNQYLSDPVEHYEVTTEAIQSAYDKYLNIYAEIIDRSWTPGRIDQQFRMVPRIVEESLALVKHQCATGINDEKFELAIQSNQELPKYEFDWSIFIRLDSSDPFKYSGGDYRAYNYLEENKTRRFLFDASRVVTAGSSALVGAQFAANLNMWMQGAAWGKGAFTGALGSATSSAAAVLPYAAAAMVIIAFAMDFSAQRKMNKLKMQMYKAEMYKFQNTKRSPWLKEKFAERCGTMISLLDAALVDLQVVAGNIDNPKGLQEYFEPLQKEMAEQTKAYSAYREAKDTLQLEAHMRAKKCVSFEEYLKLDPDVEEAARRVLPPCYIDSKEQKSVLTETGFQGKLDNNGKLIYQEDKLKAALESFEKADGDGSLLDDKKVLATIQGQLRSVIYEMFVERRQSVISSIRDYYGNPLQRQRREAFQRLLALIGVYRAQETREATERLRREQRIFTEFKELERGFKELLSAGIRMTFASLPFDDYRMHAKSYRYEFEKFYEKYKFVPDVRDLMDQLVRLEKATGLGHSGLAAL